MPTPSTGIPAVPVQSQVLDANGRLMPELTNFLRQLADFAMEIEAADLTARAAAARSVVPPSFVTDQDLLPIPDATVNLGGPVARFKNLMLSGALGVGGAAAPAYPADIRGPGTHAAQVHIADGDRNDGTYLMNYQAGAVGTPSGFYITQGAENVPGSGWVARASQATGIVVSAAGSVVFWYNTGLTPGVAYTPTGVFQIDLTTGVMTLSPSTSAIGVGKTPAYPIDVAGNCNVTGSYLVNGSPLSTGGNAAGSSGQIQFNGGGTAFAASPNLNWNNSLLRLGVNITAPAVPLHVWNTAGASSATAPTLYIGGAYSATVGSGVSLRFVDSGPNALGEIRSITEGSGLIGMAFSTWNGSSVERVRISAAGNVGIGVTGPTHLLQLASNDAALPSSTVWINMCDGRVKEDVAPFTDGLDAVLKLRPVSYKLNGKAGLPKGLSGIAIIAEEAREVIPYCIGSRRGKLDDSDAEETDILTLNASAMPWLLVNAVQELSKRVKTLEALIADRKAAR